MVLKRIIPCLLIKNGGLVKTLKFKQPKYVGDPINAVKIFSEKEADEIIILDIEASKIGKINFDLIKNIFSECFVPITYGGGIDSLDKAKKIINLGAEKICIQKIFFENKNVVKDIIKHFGSQSVVLSIDIKKNFLGKFKIWNYITNNFYETQSLEKFIKEAADLGVGEIILTDVDNEGTQNGTNKELIKSTHNILKIPLIYNGGIKDLDDIKKTFDAGSHAIGVGSFFVFYGKHRAVLITYPSDKIKNVINE